MIHVMNVVCGFELREEQIQFYIWLKEISTSETGRHRPPFSAYLLTNIFVQVLYLHLYNIYGQREHFREINVKWSHVKKYIHVIFKRYLHL